MKNKYKDQSQSIESDSEKNYGKSVDAKLKPAMRSSSVNVGDNVDLLNNTDMPMVTTGSNDEELADEEELANFNRAIGMPSPELPKKKK